MKISSLGHYYQNFRYGRVFVVRGENCVTLKSYKTWKGKHYELCAWVCISIKSRKPIIYASFRGGCPKNVTYQAPLMAHIDCVLCYVLSGKNKNKEASIKTKFLTLCGNLLGENQNITGLNARCIKPWLPLLGNFSDYFVFKIIPLLKYSMVRQGFKQESFKHCIKFWFGSSPKGLIKRIDKIFQQQNFPQLLLALSCRGWNLDHLYSLLDLNVYWDTDIDIRKASLLMSTYTEKTWLRLLKTHKASTQHEMFDAIEMFYELEDYKILPLRPKSITQIHDRLADETGLQKLNCLRGLPLSQEFPILDGIEVGRLKLVVPKVSDDLIFWGQQLKNCLIFYINKVIDLDYAVIGVFLKNEIKYAVGIFNGHIEQFYGVCNTLPLPEDEKIIRKTLIRYGIN